MIQPRLSVKPLRSRHVRSHRTARAAELIGRHVPPTPQYNWPLLSQRLGCEVWVKHENHTPAGAFKVRGGLLYVHELLGREPRLPGMISATRGNHGISRRWPRDRSACR